MESKELALLDKEVEEARCKLVELNNEYNTLLTNIHCGGTNVKKPVVSKREARLVKASKILRKLYWISFAGLVFAYCGLGLPKNIYIAAIFADIVVYQVTSIVLAVKTAKERRKNGGEPTNNNTNSNKDELFARVCEARELYHTLRKKREEALINVNENDYQEYLDYVEKIQNPNEVHQEVVNTQEGKVLSLENTKGGN